MPQSLLWMIGKTMEVVNLFALLHPLLQPYLYRSALSLVDPERHAHLDLGQWLCLDICSTNAAMTARKESRLQAGLV